MSAVISFLILVFVGRLHELVPGTQYLKPVFLGLAAGVLGQLMFYRPPPTGFRIIRAPFVLWIVFSVLVCTSFVTSIYMQYTADFLFYKYLSLGLMMFMVCYNLINFSSLESTTLALVAVVIGLGVAMIIDPHALPLETGRPRLSVGETFDSNDLALIMVMCVPMLWYWFWRGGMGTKSLVVVATGLALFTIYRTGSRGGLLSLGFVAAYMFFFVKEMGLPLRIVLFVGMLGGGAFITTTSTFSDLVAALQGNDYNLDDDDGRLAIWSRGWGYALERPINGVGADCFTFAEEMMSPRKSLSKGFKSSTAHNSYIQVLVETGFPAVLCWFCMIVASARLLNRQIRTFRPFTGNQTIHRYVMMCSMVRCSLLAFLLGGFFLSLGYLPLLYVMIAYSMSLANIGDVVLAEGSHEEALTQF